MSPNVSLQWYPYVKELKAIFIQELTINISFLFYFGLQKT
ncbi:hypothetical protein SAMN06265348_105129 [Pedobacter westerhofensis]|uniref:Uncharacterized protein n=1 Tax=Pedobacter westerhofensis TaxID=425512 RepID=A0A521D905_9SPHI|nr:hypothetical protein SAMN06265348_105129 [Pedobacter westerhofensis]